MVGRSKEKEIISISNNPHKDTIKVTANTKLPKLSEQRIQVD